MKIVFLTTVQFSGTRLLSYTVADATKPHSTRMQIANVKGFYRIADRVEGKLTHTNTNNISELIEWIRKRLSLLNNDHGDNFTVLITAHIGDSHCGFIPFKDQEVLIDTLPTAVTLRDPLASLLTREGRRYDDYQQYLVDGYVSLAKTKKDIYRIPVDLYANKPYEERYALFKGLFDFLKIKPLDNKYIAQTAMAWKVRGNTQDDVSVSDFDKRRAAQLKGWYKSGDIKEIIKVIPRCYEYLKSKEKIIRPMLERYGYSNLIWWS